MAFTTEALTDLGLDKDQVKSVMAMKGEAIKESENADALIAERDDLQRQLAERDKDIKQLQKDSEDNEALSAQLKELETKYDTDTKKLNETLAENKLNNAIAQALGSTNARDPQDLKAFLDTGDIKFNEDGELVGLSEQIETLKTDKAYLFNGEKKQEYKPAGGSSSTQATNLSEAMKSDDFNLTEYLQAQGE